MPTLDLMKMSEHYRKMRIDVFQKATRPEDGSAAGHERNKNKLKERVLALCDEADLSHYAGSDESAACRIWRHLWTKIRFAGIRTVIAEKEIQDIGFVFDDFRVFSKPSWDIHARGHVLVSAGSAAQHFLDRTGLFKECQTIGNLPKLCKTVSVARRLADFMDRKGPNVPALHFVTNGRPANDVWTIHEHLMGIGYTADLTALHLMMDLGFQVMKPDVVISRLFLRWGWLAQIVPQLPVDLSKTYTKAVIYRPIIDLARKIVDVTEQTALVSDIGWATNNPLREFDIFVVKYGQVADRDFGIERCLAEATRPS